MKCISFHSRERTMVARSVSDASSMAPSEAPSEFELRKRIKSSSAFKSVQGMVMEYCKNTSVHGLQYLGERRRPFIERQVVVVVVHKQQSHKLTSIIVILGYFGS